MRFPILSTVTLLGLPLAGIASPYGGSNARSHQELVVHPRETTELSPQASFNGRLTFYDVGLGTCGKVNVASDFVVALNTPQYGSSFISPHCFQTIQITANGKTAQATIVDECITCPIFGLDLSRGLFQFFASLDAGLIQGTWSFVDASKDAIPSNFTIPI